MHRKIVRFLNILKASILRSFITKLFIDLKADKPMKSLER